jgi:hypothetical protein
MIPPCLLTSKVDALKDLLVELLSLLAVKGHAQQQEGVSKALQSSRGKDSHQLQPWSQQLFSHGQCWPLRHTVQILLLLTSWPGKHGLQVCM